jgi:hypothetical protein
MAGNPLNQLAAQAQSIRCETAQRSLLKNGDLAAKIVRDTETAPQERGMRK